MKTIVTKENNASKFLVNDESDIFIEEDKTIIGHPYNDTVWDCDSSNVKVIENIIDAPEDWIGNKYCYDETTEEKWVLNPDYIPPMTDEEIAAIIKRDASEKEQVVSE